MRTKTLLLSAAAIAAGVASLKAQSNVYSLNVVGYVNVNLAAGFNMIANPLDDGAGDTLTNVIGNATGTALPDGSALYPWAGTTYGNALQYYYSYGWYDSSLGGYATNTVPPGVGFMLQCTSPTNYTFVGSVLQGTATNNLNAGFNMIGNVFPVAEGPGADSFTTTAGTWALPVQDGDSLYTFDPVNGYYAYQFYGSYGWYDSGNPSMSTNGPTIAVGQGVFLAKQSANSWVESFTVTP